MAWEADKYGGGSLDVKMMAFMGKSLPPRAMKLWVDMSRCTFLDSAEKEIAMITHYHW
tara:strand:+ start:439 stop:612 length:174 start_codon:yes stop_codon:yes gene_type:complete